MSPRRWFFLLLFYISYLMFGASIYYHIEHNLEKHQRSEALQERIEINEYLVENLSHKNQSKQNEILERITDYCGKPVTNYTLDKYEDPYRWTFYHSLFFAFTVCSTVGYGNLSPSTTLGRMIMIVYSLIGIPINGILFAGLGDFFSRTFIGIYKRYKKYKISNDARYVPRQFSLLATIAIALLPGILFFIILPSVLFSYFENWPFSLSIYYSYVTTTTIGFGDYVPTFQPHQEREYGVLFVFYQIFIIVWFIFSLGYLVMIMTYITKGFRSKRLVALEHQLAHNIRATQHRIWHGVTKDVGYLRRILNELYIMKFKPVYNEPGENLLLHRSISCPELEMYRIDTPVFSRKRAFSESFELQDDRQQPTPLIKGSSDTDLSKINKQKTFETAEAFKHTTDLLAKVVSALASIEPPEETVTAESNGLYGGYHGFSDSQILSSEWSFPATNEIPHRVRSSSDFYLNPRKAIDEQWTWSGDNSQIQQAINNRVRGINDNSVIVNIGSEVRKRKKTFSLSDNSKNFFKKLNPFKRSQELSTEHRKLSVASVPETPEKFPKIDCYSTITGNVSSPFFANEKNNASTVSSYTSVSTSPGGRVRTQSEATTDKPGNSISESTWNGAARVDRSKFLSPPGKERRQSLLLQYPSNRRPSLLAPSTLRRGSLFSDIPERNRNVTNRRPSLFSVPCQEDINEDVLENTTIADLIRAIEVIHTQATLREPPVELKKKRKLGTDGLTPPNLPVFAIFPPDEEQLPNRLYSRRSTVVGTLSSPGSYGSVATRTRRLSSAQTTENNAPSNQKETTTFKRRFSVRPTNLQTPPGKAPPTSISSANSAHGALSPTPPSQAVFQRRLSLRPSPLALPSDFGRTNQAPSSRFTPSIQSNLSRSGASSTHSPLSRIVQITQATRRGSLPDSKDKKEGK